MPRDEVIIIRVTQEEKARAILIAAERRTTISDYLRQCIKLPRKPRKQQQAA